MNYPNWPIVPGHGWGPVLLGEKLPDLKKILTEAKVSFEAEDDSQLYLFGDTSCLFFEEGGEQRLVQIAIGDESQTLNGEQIIDIPLDEALSVTHLKNYDETSWSTSDLYFDLFSTKDSPTTKKKPRAIADNVLLDNCTLWLTELGIGMSLDEGKVETLALRRKDLIPKPTVGPLTSAQLKILSDPKFEKRLASERKFTASSSTQNPTDWIGTISTILLPFAIAFLGYLGWNVYSHWQAWNHAIPTTGIVTQILPEEGPFKDFVVAEYDVPGLGKKTTSILWTQAPASEVGKEIKLAYLPNDPDKAKTIYQAKSEALLGGIPSNLFIVGAAIACVIINSAIRQYQRKLYGPKRNS